MTELQNKNKNNNSMGNLEDLIQLYLVAIDNKNKNKVENIYNINKEYTEENDIVFEMYNNKLLNTERLQYIINNCRNYLNISSSLVKKLMKTNNDKLLDIIFEYGMKFFDNEIIIELLHCYKNKTPISDLVLNQKLDNDKYKIPLEWNYKKFDNFNTSHYLFNACEKENKIMIKYLIEHGADITIKDKSNRTVLFDACLKGNEHLVRYLVGRGANINEEDNDGYTPIFNSYSSGNKDLIKYLVGHGANTNKEANNGTTPIFNACSSGNENLV